ncbi:MAG: N-acetylmuramoyl-L-alanine amidase [Clostridia bacterium]|nr:N-acetylmuramoyl-L-alanine amidase [Clostridia bacterium]
MSSKNKNLIIACISVILVFAAITAGVFFMKDRFKVKVDPNAASTETTQEQIIAKSKAFAPPEIRAVVFDSACGAPLTAEQEMQSVSSSGFNTVIFSLDNNSGLTPLAQSARSRGLYSGVISGADDAQALLTENNFDFIILANLDEAATDFESKTVALINELRRIDPGITIGIKPSVTSEISPALNTIASAGQADFLFVEQKAEDENGKEFEKARQLFSDAALNFWLCHSLDGINSMSDSKASDVLALFSQSLETPGCTAIAFAPFSQIRTAESSVALTVIDFICQGVESASNKEFKLSNYSSNSITVTQSRITFKGTSSPVYPLTCNGKSLERAASGDFASEFKLEAGKNTFRFEHKDKTYVYEVTYKVKLLSSVSPTDSISVPGSTELEVTAIGKSGATLYASFNGDKVKMSEGEAVAEDEGTSPDSESDFVAFHASFTLPEGTTQKQKLGSIKITASYGSLSESMTGASVTVNAVEPAPIIIPETTTTTTTEQTSELSTNENEQDSTSLSENSSEQTSESTSESTETTSQSSSSSEKYSYSNNYGLGTAKICVINTDYCEVFPGSTTSSLSVPLYTPQLSGTIGYVTGEMDCTDTKGTKEHYYVLSSGIKVYDGFSTVKSGYVMPNNKITVSQSSKNGNSLEIVLDMNWKVPVNAELKGQSYKSVTINGTNRPYAVSSVNAQSLDITFSYTDSATGKINTGGAISSASWDTNRSATTTTLSLKLADSGKFYGFHMEYEGDKLVITVNGKPSSTLSGYTIMLDPGHGGNDSGAICSVSSNYSMRYESYINLGIAKKIQSLLESEGATVIMTRTSDTYVSPEARVEMIRNRNPDLFLSIHCDSSSSSTPYGTSAYYYRAYSQPLAKAVHESIVDAYKGDIYSSSKSGISRGANFYPFQVTRVEECPAILIEYGFVSNITECELLQKSSTQSTLAEATVKGIKNYIAAN